MSLSTLHARARDAIEELRAIRCSDPAAAPALDAVRLTALTLESLWLPELARAAARSLK